MYSFLQTHCILNPFKMIWTKGSQAQTTGGGCLQLCVFVVAVFKYTRDYVDFGPPEEHFFNMFHWLVWGHFTSHWKGFHQFSLSGGKVQALHSLWVCGPVTVSEVMWSCGHDFQLPSFSGLIHHDLDDPVTFNLPLLIRTNMYDCKEWYKKKIYRLILLQPPCQTSIAKNTTLNCNYL